MSRIVQTVSKITRRYPGAVDALRKALPLAAKRKIGAMLLPSTHEGTITSKDGRSFEWIPDRLFLQVVYDGVFEPSLSNVIRNHIEPGDTCVDIGSNFGWFATLMAQHGAQVIAFEPARRINGVLQRNIALNDLGDRIEVRKRAVGATAEQVQFVIEGDEARESALGYVSKDAPSDPDARTETVDIVRLEDDLADVRDRIALMKLDAEGFEHYAVQGATALFTGAHPPILITEANDETARRSGTSRAALRAELEGLGYELFAMNADGVLEPDRDGRAPAWTCRPPRGQFAERMA